MKQPIHTCLTKAIIADGDQLRNQPKWATARRARLKLYDDHLQCGDWNIAYRDIRDAELASFRSHVLRIPGYLLSVRTDTKTYHFGLNGWRFWEGDLPFPVTRKAAKLRMSPVSLLARAVVAGYIAFLAWRWLAP